MSDNAVDRDPEYWIARAVSALRLYSGSINRATAHRLLPSWREYQRLDDDDVNAILERFPNPYEDGAE